MRDMKFDFGSLGQPFEADWPVFIPVPQSGGGIDRQKLVVRFRMADDEILVAMGTGIPAAKEGLRTVVVGFGKGESETFSPELLELMLDRAYVRTTLIQAYGQFALGQAAEKN